MQSGRTPLQHLSKKKYWSDTECAAHQEVQDKRELAYHHQLPQLRILKQKEQQVTLKGILADPYEYSFYSDFKSPIEDVVEKINKSLTLFTIFGIFIAALGLLGLSAFMVEQKTKEIGIRKAMGASVQEILSIITKQFFKLILIANLIALPISYLIHNYAGNFFTIKTSGDIFVFIFVFLFIFSISFLIIYLVTIKAARANPAKSLRYE